VVPYFERSHWTLFMLESNRTFHFDSIHGFHNTSWANWFVKCVELGWEYTKGIPLNSSQWVMINLKLIIHVLVHLEKGSWEFGYLVVENFVNYLHRRGDKDHIVCIDVNTILELICFPTIVVSNMIIFFDMIWFNWKHWSFIYHHVAYGLDSN
jgi:hypothetical protein